MSGTGPGIVVEERTPLPPELRDSLSELLRRPVGMDDVVRLFARLDPPGRVLAVVAQDECTHDYLLGVGEDGLTLVFGCT